MKKATIYMVLGLSMTACPAEDSQREVINRLKALEAEVAKLPRSTPVRWATANKDTIRNAMYARGREKLEELKKTESLTPELEAKLALYEKLNQELMFKPRPTFQPTRPQRGLPMPPSPSPDPPLAKLKLELARLSSNAATSSPLPPTDLTSSSPNPPTPPAPVRQPGQSAEPVKPALPSPPSQPKPTPTPEEAEYEALTKRVAEAKAPVAAILEWRAKITGKYYDRGYLEELIAEYAKDKFDLVINADRMTSYDKPILYRTPAEAPDITEAILKLFHERENK